MKIRIIKDIPGYKTGEIINGLVDGKYLSFNPGYALNESGEKCDLIKYPIDQLVTEGFAEEVKDEIDIREIKRGVGIDLSEIILAANTSDRKKKLAESVRFLGAYEIVKAVIEKLNGEWEPTWENGSNNKWNIDFHWGTRCFDAVSMPYAQQNILPVCQTAIKTIQVIELCKPELEILFGVK